ncbi:MAG: hypothetical protein ABR956_15665 [Terracidiphilus sp.]|jgi:outer membrane lipoprotein-sorting protein
MRAHCRFTAAGALFLPLLITGCSLFPTTRKLPMPKAPTITQNAAPEELVAHLNERWDALKTLTATVEIRASLEKSKEGTATDYPSVHGNILIRKPGDLRVLGRYFGVLAFDMASDDKNFTLFIPTKNKVIRGSNSLKTQSANTWENLRPGFFLDAMLVRGLEPDDQYSVTSETFVVEDAARKHLFSVPEYILRITRPKAGSQQQTLVRVVYFHRDDLLPYQQDIYDSEGKFETQVMYAAYQDFDGGKYPSIVTIKRPLEGIQIVLTVDDVHQNMLLKDDQFAVTFPPQTQVQNLQ